MRQLSLRTKKSALTLAMCTIAVLAGMSTKLLALVHTVSAEQCCGAGECVNPGECYPGVAGHTGSVCGSDGYWSNGCY